MTSKKTNRIIAISIIIVISIFILAIIYRKFISNLVPIISSIDGNEYMVQNTENKQEAADKLAKLCVKLNSFVSTLVKENPDDKRVQRLKNNFKCHKITEGNGAFGYTSYTTNKGDEMVLCMRDMNGNLHKENMLTFVALHEMSHVASKTFGHNKEFLTNFVWLIEKAEALNIYKHQDFNSNPKAYCGIKVTSTPH